MNPHEVLGVPTDAPADQIREAFRRYVQVHHPDRGGDKASFRLGLDAYRTLSGRHEQSWTAPVVAHRRPRGLEVPARWLGGRFSRLVTRVGTAWRRWKGER